MCFVFIHLSNLLLVGLVSRSCGRGGRCPTIRLSSTTARLPSRRGGGRARGAPPQASAPTSCAPWKRSSAR
eukprot:552724-Prorocentrum_minimum.AAC.2